MKENLTVEYWTIRFTPFARLGIMIHGDYHFSMHHHGMFRSDFEFTMGFQLHNHCQMTVPDAQQST